MKLCYTKDGVVQVEPFGRKEPQYYIDLIVSRGYSDAIITDVPNRDGAPYVITNGVLTTSLEKAKEIKLEAVRSKRKALFEIYDREFIERLSQDLDLTDLKLKQQNARDIPALINAASNLTALDAINLATN